MLAKQLVGTTQALSTILLIFVISGCSIIQSPPIAKIALLAPFEGRYRDIGYNALYAVRLAMSDSQTEDIHLLAVDDGGTVESAIDRMQALNNDPDVKFIIALGNIATHPNVQQANDKTLIIVGFWGNSYAGEDTLIVSHPEIAEQVTTVQAITDLDLDEHVTGGDLYMLEQLPDLYPNLDNLTIISSGILPNQDFRERYLNSDLYVPEPNLLATLIYDVAQLIVSMLRSNSDITPMQYEGINGRISFSDGYWTDAPINRFQYVGEQLTIMD